MTTLSVIIPVYNYKEYLENCVSSVIAVNTHCNKAITQEIILVDDGSTDGSAKLCDSIAESMNTENCDIRVIHQKNAGVSAARNAGLRAAKGMYVFFVDSDDTVEPQNLARIIDSVAENPLIDMAVFGMTFDYYDHGRLYKQDRMLPSIEGIRTIDECIELLSDLFDCNMVSSLCNKLFRKELFEGTEIRLREDMILYEDLEFSLRTMAECKSIFFRSIPVYRYRQAFDEGNAGRRLKRIDHIPGLMDKIETALEPLGGSNEILLKLYLVLARERISCASKTETDVVCDDFKSWIKAHGLLKKIQGSEYGMLLYNRKSARLLMKRYKTAFRHEIANAIKKTVGDFRKWR